MPQLLDNLTYTWNNVGTTFTGIRYQVTDTASAAGSLLMDLRTTADGSRFSVNKAGVVNINGMTITRTSAESAVISSASLYQRVKAYTFWDDPQEAALGDPGSVSNSRLSLGNNKALGWTSGATVNSGSFDVYIQRDNAAGVLAQRNSTNAQTFRLYNTFTTATDYQRLAVSSATATLTAMSGATVTATNLIPAGAVVVGVTARVTTEITGATGFQIGITGALDRWADKTGVAVGTTTDNRDWTAGTIECFPAATNVIVTAKTSNFTAGAMRLVVHYIAGEAD